MQISKRLAQNIVEFAFVFPILIILTLAIFEVAFFWQDVNAVHSLNNEINANAALIDIQGIMMGQTCPGAQSSVDTLKLKDATITMTHPQYTKEILNGEEPFALYKFDSDIKIKDKPLVSLWVDCRNPYEDGVTTQLEFYHKTIVMKASIPRFDSPEPIVIIPSDIHIVSPKLNTIRHY